MNYTIATGSYQPDGAVTLYRRTTEGFEAVGRGGPGRVSFIATTRDGLTGVVEADSGQLVELTLSQLDVFTTSQIALHESAPCFLVVLPDSQILIANYGSGSVTLMPGLHTVRFPELPSGRAPRQESSHAHHAVETSWGTVLVSDLGSDCLVELDVEADQPRVIRTIPIAAGAGPRHMTWLGSRLVVIGELDSALHILSITASDAREVQVIRSYGGEADDQSQPSHVATDPTGRWVLVLNRGRDTVAVFDGSEESLRLHTEVPCGGTWPRHFAFVGDRVLVANQRSDSIAEFEFNHHEGSLRLISSFASPAPSCIVEINHE
ncbi:beta-propeller fold lactonase family protein [Salinibacterium sp. G-O1]|uniref:lactonase family protein n=1 Tax=Salinibacterium sp. G-O1 TaxID=3046208 RepID=UPI0024BB514C|nr:beta-propeller fold lactonase family protein [Salinibacterium sp. G-O1]MDJ0334930.1 beta-propeller fold lactonase family protein [Salinibacterium sp. G-O1]